MIELKFEAPVGIYADNDFSGRKYKFPYNIKFVTKSPKIDNEIQHKVIISISNILFKRWNYQNEADLFKVFFLLVTQLIQDKLIEGNLNEVEYLELHTNTFNSEIKYDPQKINNFIDKVYTLDLDELKRNKNKVKIGFKMTNEE